MQIRTVMSAAQASAIKSLLPDLSAVLDGVLSQKPDQVVSEFRKVAAAMGLLVREAEVDDRVLTEQEQEAWDGLRSWSDRLELRLPGNDPQPTSGPPTGRLPGQDDTRGSGFGTSPVWNAAESAEKWYDLRTHKIVPVLAPEQRYADVVGQNTSGISFGRWARGEIFPTPLLPENIVQWPHSSKLPARR